MVVPVPTGVRCYECGHEYAHLGTDVHPGRCPQCRSRAVSPAGRLEFTVTVDASSMAAQPRATAVGTDETYRTFLVELDGDERRDVAVDFVQIEGMVFTAADLPADPRLWEPLERTIRHSGALRRGVRRDQPP